MTIQYQLIEKEKLFIQRFQGTFSFHDYKEYAKIIFPALMGKNIDKILIDIRNTRLPDKHHAKIDKHVEKLTNLRKRMDENIKVKKDLKHVFIVDKPWPTIMVELFIENFEYKKYKYCSTLNCASGFLQLDTDKVNLKEILSNLEFTFNKTNAYISV